MKAIISIMIIVIGVLVFVVVGNDSATVKTAQYTDQAVESFSSNNEESADKEVTANSNQKASKSVESTKLYAENTSNNNQPANDNYSRYESTGSSYYGDSSSYDGQSSSYSDNSASYNQDTTYYGNNDSSYANSGSSYGQNNSDNDNNSSTSQVNSNSVSDNQNNSDSKDTESSEVVEANEDEETTEEQETENLKYQRLYDNGIMWYGNTGTLMIEYESSHAQTTGIGFRVHFDSTAIRPINITQFPVDAIITTTPNTVMADKDNRDNNAATDSFLPFAWASIYGQWPQTNELNLASIDFEKVNGGSDNYTVNYSVVSVPAGFQLIK